MLNFKLAELRKKNNLTQQEMGDILCVSYQTISKWENGVVYPDINMLPQISEYFGVSVDALLGLEPLDQSYIPSTSGKAQYWEKQIEYLQRTRTTMWNEEYVKYLIQDVWKIDRPVSILDCGCGYGSLGLLLMPLLPLGSTYTGVDFSEVMIETAKKYAKESNIQAEFAVADIMDYEPKMKYDIVISQAVLRHADNGETLLRKMVTFLREGGILISIECNREFETDGLYVRGMDYAKLCRHDGLSKLWETELEMQNRDYSIAMKIPHYMTSAGLKNVSSRMNDKVTYLEPSQSDYSEILDSMAKAEHWNEEKTDREIEDNIAFFMNHGMSRKDAEEYCRQKNGIVKFMKKNAGEVALTKTTALMISYGWK